MYFSVHIRYNSSDVSLHVWQVVRLVLATSRTVHGPNSDPPVHRQSTKLGAEHHMLLLKV
jgi:hypothetical protein